MEQIKTYWNKKSFVPFIPNIKIIKNSVFFTQKYKNAINRKIKKSQTISLYPPDALEHLLHLFHFIPVYMYLYMNLYLFKKRKGQNALHFFTKVFYNSRIISTLFFEMQNKKNRCSLKKLT